MAAPQKMRRLQFINCSPACSDIQRKSGRRSCAIFGAKRRSCFKLVEERRRELIQRYFGRIFDQGRRAGIIRKDISSEMIVEILLGAVQAVMNPAKIEHLGLEPKTGYGAIVSVILDGAMTEKGRSK